VIGRARRIPTSDVMTMGFWMREWFLEHDTLTGSMPIQFDLLDEKFGVFNWPVLEDFTCVPVDAYYF
jgi:hypothetical protein